MIKLLTYRLQSNGLTYTAMNKPVYTAIFFKVHRLLQLGKPPPKNFLGLVQQQGLADHLEIPVKEFAEQMFQETPTRLSLVKRWLAQTEGWQRVRATYDNERIFSPEGILWIAEQSEWARLGDMSDLLYVHQGIMHPACLELGWGNPLTAYQDPKSQTARVYFFSAYSSCPIPDPTLRP